MSDLTARFNEFEEQVATQHTAIANKLDAILVAMGAPPPTATTTLADIATLLTAINNNLIGVAIANGAFYNAVLAALESMNLGNGESIALLEQISTNTDLMLTNNSGNAQLLIATLLQTSCPCDPAVALLPPPLGVLPTSANDIAKCQRIQYFLDLYRSWVINMGQWVFAHGSISSYEVAELLSIGLLDRDITTGELSSGIPTAIKSSIVAKLTNAVAAVGKSQVDGGLWNIVEQSILDSIRDALYGVTTAIAGKAAFDATIIAAGGTSWITEVAVLMFYNAWANDIYNAVPIIDASEYSGVICAEPEVLPCQTLYSEEISTHHVIYFPPSHTKLLSGDYYGSTIRILTGGRVHAFRDGVSIEIGAGPMAEPWTVDLHTSTFEINIAKFLGGPFSIEWCDASGT